MTQGGEATNMPSGFPLQVLPEELLYYLVAFLPADTRACLALTSRAWFRRCCGADCLKLSGKPLREFSQTLERDMLDVGYCRGCHKLHHQSYLIDGINPARNHWYKCSARMQGAKNLPPLLRHDLLRLIMRQHNQSHDVNGLLRKLGTNSTQSGLQSVELSTFKVIEGRLHVRTTGVVLPFKKAWNLPVDPLTPLARPVHAIPLCKHKHWIVEYPVTSYILDRPFWLKHRTNDPSHELTLFRIMDTKAIRPIYGTEDVKCCHLCFTDYSMAVIDTKSLGRVVALTTWKDVGDGASIWDPRWAANFTKYHRRERAMKRADLPGIYMKFEKVHTQDGQLLYNPVLDESELSEALSRQRIIT